jgi:hypothetical protein
VQDGRNGDVSKRPVRNFRTRNTDSTRVLFRSGVVAVNLVPGGALAGQESAPAGRADRAVEKLRRDSKRQSASRSRLGDGWQ